MANNPTIDDLRDAAISLEVGGHDDGLTGGEFYKVGKERLLLIYGKAAYEMILPDEVDPARSNPRIRPVHKKVLQFGFEDEYVARILLTEKVLVAERRLPGVEEGRVSALAFEFLQDVLFAREMCGELERLQEAAEKDFKSRQQTRSSTRLPSIPDIEVRCESFIQRARHAVGSINSVAVAFCGDELKKKKWMQHLGRLLEAEAGDVGAHRKNWQALETFIESVTEARNAIEHPKDGYRFEITDYSLGSDNVISPPMITLVHPALKIGPVSALAFAESATKNLVVLYENVLAALCDLKLRGQKGAPMYVIEIPLAQRRNKFVSYGVAIEIGGKINLLQ